MKSVLFNVKLLVTEMKKMPQRSWWIEQMWEIVPHRQISAYFPIQWNKILEFPDISLIIQTDCCFSWGGALWWWTGGHSWLGEGQTENVCKHLSELWRADPKSTARDVVRASCFSGLVLRTFHTSVEATVSEELRAASAGRIPLSWLVLRCRTYSAHLVACWSWLWPCCSSAGNQ